MWSLMKESMRISWAIYWKGLLAGFLGAIMSGFVVGLVIGLVMVGLGFQPEEITPIATRIGLLLGLICGFLGFNWAVAFTLSKTIGGKRLMLLNEYVRQ